MIFQAFIVVENSKMSKDDKFVSSETKPYVCISNLQILKQISEKRDFINGIPIL